MVSVRTLHLDDLAVETVVGEIDLAASRALLERVLAEPADRILIDCRAARKTLSFGDVLRFVAEARCVPALYAKRVALLNSPFNRAEVTQLMGARFHEEGLPIRDFYDPDAAVAWLEADDAP